MRSQKLSGDGDARSHPLKPKSKIPVRVSSSSSDSEKSTGEESGRKNRPSRRTRIPIAASRRASGSYSVFSGEVHRTLKAKAIDSGVILEPVQKKDVSIKKEDKNATGIFLASKTKSHGQKSKSASPRDTKASALRKQAVLEKAAASSGKPKQGKGKISPIVLCGAISFKEDAEENQVQSTHAPGELPKEVKCDTVQLENESEASKRSNDQEVTDSYSDESFEQESSSAAEDRTTAFEFNSSLCSLGYLTDKVVEEQLSEQAILTNNDGVHVSDLKEKSMFCGESKQLTAGIQLQKKQSLWKFFDRDDDQDDAVDSIKNDVSDERNLHLDVQDNKSQEQDANSDESKSVDETQRLFETNSVHGNEIESRKTTDGLLQENEVSWALSVSDDDDDEKFEQQKEKLKSRIQQQLRELEKERSLMVEEFAQASNAVRHSERDIKTVEEEEFEKLLNERNETLDVKAALFKKNENQPKLKIVIPRNKNGKVQDPKISSEELLMCPEEKKCNLAKIKTKVTEEDERIKKLNMSQQKNKENKERFRKSFELAERYAGHQARDNDNRLNKKSLHDVNENSDYILKGELKLVQKELKDTVNTVAQRDAELVEAQGLLREGDELIYEFRKSLTEMQQELEETKMALIAKDEALESASKHANYEDSFLKEMLTKVVLDVTRVVKVQAKLQSLLQEKDQNIKGREILIAQLKQDLQQYDTYVKEKDNSIEDFKTTLVELKRNLELNSSSLRGKDKTIEELETSAKASKQELDKKNSSLREKDDQIKQLEFSNAQRTNDLEQSSSCLKERNNRIKDLESSVQQLKEFVELTNISLNERSNELQQMKSYAEEKERELSISNAKSSLLQEENSCLKNESLVLQTHLSRCEEDIKGLKRGTLTKNSELREVNRELETLKHLVQEKEQRIDFLKRSLATKDHDNDILTENMKKRFFEIITLKGTLDEAKNERQKFSELFFLQRSYFETKIKRLNLEVDCNNILLGKKERALETANLGIQAKEGELTLLRERLCKQEMRFELYKKISTEAEYKIVQEKRALEKSLREMETGICEKNNEKMKVERFPNVIESDSKAVEHQPLNESDGLEVNGSYSEELKGKDVEEQIKRLEQMEANVAAMKKKLVKSRKNNTVISKKNKELKEKVNKLQKEVVKGEQRLNETLDKVHRMDQEMVLENDDFKMAKPTRPEMAEGTIQELKELQITEHVSRELSELSVEQNDYRQENPEPDVPVANSMQCVSLTQLPMDSTQKTDASDMNDDVSQKPADPKVLVEDNIQETIDPLGQVNDDCKEDGPELQDSWDTTEEMSDLKLRQNVSQELDEPQLAKNDEMQDTAGHEGFVNDYIHDLPNLKETEGTLQDTDDAKMADHVPQELVEPHSPVGNGLQDVTEPEMLVSDLVQGMTTPQVTEVFRQGTDDSQRTEHNQKELDLELPLPIEDDRGELVKPQAEGDLPQGISTPKSSISNPLSLSLSDLGF